MLATRCSHSLGWLCCARSLLLERRPAQTQASQRDARELASFRALGRSGVRAFGLRAAGAERANKCRRPTSASNGRRQISDRAANSGSRDNCAWRQLGCVWRLRRLFAGLCLAVGISIAIAIAICRSPFAICAALSISISISISLQFVSVCVSVCVSVSALLCSVPVSLWLPSLAFHCVRLSRWLLFAACAPISPTGSTRRVCLACDRSSQAHSLCPLGSQSRPFGPKAASLLGPLAGSPSRAPRPRASGAIWPRGRSLARSRAHSGQRDSPS